MSSWAYFTTRQQSVLVTVLAICKLFSFWPLIDWTTVRACTGMH